MHTGPLTEYVSHTQWSLYSNQSWSSLFSQIQWLAFSTASWIFMMTCLEILTDRPIEKSHFRSLLPTNPRQPTSTGLCSACHPAFSYILTIRGKYLGVFSDFCVLKVVFMWDSELNKENCFLLCAPQDDIRFLLGGYWIRHHLSW